MFDQGDNFLLVFLFNFFNFCDHISTLGYNQHVITKTYYNIMLSDNKLKKKKCEV